MSAEQASGDARADCCVSDHTELKPKIAKKIALVQL
jgi:hypothetical protein